MTHLVTLVDGLSDLNYSFGQDHCSPQRLHGQPVQIQEIFMKINNNVYGLLTKSDGKIT